MLYNIETILETMKICHYYSGQVIALVHSQQGASLGSPQDPVLPVPACSFSPPVINNNNRNNTVGFHFHPPIVTNISGVIILGAGCKVSNQGKGST